MMNRVKKIVAIALMLCLLGSSAAFAADGSAPVTGAANVTISDFIVTTFSAITLNGTVQTATTNVTNMTLVDARGTGAGWSVNLTATQFTSDTTSNVALKVLPLNSLALGIVTIVEGTGSTPTTNIVIPASGTIDKTGGVRILNAGTNEGMGTYTVSIAPMTLTLSPKDAKAGSYASTITMTLSQGPVN